MVRVVYGAGVDFFDLIEEMGIADNEENIDEIEDRLESMSDDDIEALIELSTNKKKCKEITRVLKRLYFSSTPEGYDDYVIGVFMFDQNTDEPTGLYEATKKFEEFCEVFEVLDCLISGTTVKKQIIEDLE